MITRFSRRRISIAVILAICATSVSANCIVCDEVIVINEARANCLADNFESIATAIGGAPNGRKSVDLDACSIDGEQLSVRGGLDTLPDLNSLSEEAETTVKSSYLLDLNYLTCLQRLIDSENRPIDPDRTFDLFLSCQS